MPMSAPAISVIVVFHNAETTIERTLRSIARQSMTDVEYIFVDDGSTDRTVEIIRDFMALYPDMSGRHLLISGTVRRGLAHGSATGYAHAGGEYVMRCDADDYLSPDALNVLWDASGHGVFDAVFAPYIRECGDKSCVVGFRRKPMSLNDMPIDTLHFSLCTKLLRRSILVDNGIVAFDGIDCWEDLGVVSRFMMTSPKINVIDTPVYHYVASPGGRTLSSSVNERLLREHLMMALLVEKWFVEHGAEEKYAEFLNHLKFIAKVRFMRGRDKNAAKWKNTFPEVNGVIMTLRHVGIVWRLLFKSISILPAALVQRVADMCDVFYPRSRAEAPVAVKMPPQDQ